MTAAMDGFHEVAAALRQNSADVSAYAKVLTTTLGDALPPGCVTVERARSLGDRMRGRDGRVSRVIVRLGDTTLYLTDTRDRFVPEVHHEVRGVVLSREQVSIDAWVAELTRELVAYADANARAAAALRRLISGA
ncbi:hypothetical protein [Actinomadura kijaniata]|uniref:hypothetical protein n=1 Tax=Actinomadura kijaniata TaxID=46161 RepID=UPI0008301360|nr:hypothetical protein [Actinomadura kijaniata]